MNQSNDSTIDIKGKGKGKGKGKSSQIVKSKPDSEDTASKEQAPPSPIPAVKSPKKPAKSAAELYQVCKYEIYFFKNCYIFSWNQYNYTF